MEQVHILQWCAQINILEQQHTDLSGNMKINYKKANKPTSSK